MLRLLRKPAFTLDASVRSFSEKTPRIRKGIYAGSFDPPSSGHLDIIQRGTKLCDKLYVGIAINSAKK